MKTRTSVLTMTTVLFSSWVIASQTQELFTMGGAYASTENSACRLAEDRALSNLETECESLGSFVHLNEVELGPCSCFREKEYLQRCSASVSAVCNYE